MSIKLTYCPLECPEDIPTMDFYDMTLLVDWIYENSSEAAVFVYWELAIEDDNPRNKHRKLNITCDLYDVIEYFVSLSVLDTDLNVFEFETYTDALDYCRDMWEGITKFYNTESMVEDLNRQLNSEGAQPGQA